MRESHKPITESARANKPIHFINISTTVIKCCRLCKRWVSNAHSVRHCLLMGIYCYLPLLVLSVGRFFVYLFYFIHPSDIDKNKNKKAYTVLHTRCCRCTTRLIYYR